MHAFEPWWASIIGDIFLIINLSLMALFIGGIIFLLIKMASIDRNLKAVVRKLNNKQQN